MNIVKLLSKQILVTIFFIVIASFCFSVSGASVNGTVVMNRENGANAKTNKYAKIAFYEIGSKNQVGDATYIENSSTSNSRVSYSVNVTSGSYDMVVEKEGYLPYIVQNFIVLPTYSTINLPDITLIPGDLNLDRVVNMSDLVICLRAFDLSSAFDLVRKFADINEDGINNVTDIGYIKNASYFGKTSSEVSTMQFSSEYAQTMENSRAAFYLIDDTNFVTRNPLDATMMQSGWNYDNRGGIPKLTDKAPYELNDVSLDFGTRLVRYLTTQTAGTMTLETQATISAGGDGFYYQFLSTDGHVAYKLVTDNGYFNIVSNGVTIPLNLPVSKTSFNFKITLNLDNQTSQTIINSVNYGTYGFSAKCGNINQFVIGTTDEDILYVVPSYARLYCNYGVNEQFTQTSSGIPIDWTKTTSGSSSAGVTSNQMQLNLTGVGSAAVQKSFDAISGNTCFETLFMLPSLANGASFSLMSNGIVGVSVKTQSNMIYAGNTLIRNYYLANMWYRLRIEADTRTGKAIVKINGKTVGTVDFENSVDSFNQIKINLTGSSTASLKFDEINVFRIQDVTDYVPMPVKPTKSSDNYIGVNVCSLWRNGEHKGWDTITAYDEVKPVLGFYDEGLPEVSDWEIKFMVEHGIDYQSFCWYSSQSNAPIKTTMLSGAIHSGFMNAKYSNMMKFALLWEAANGTHPASSAAFRSYFVPYWVEYFFTDPRYMVIENKPVISVFGYNQLITDFGSAANVAIELDYVRSECRKLGFDGAIFIACNSSSTATELQKVKDCGFDAVQAYNWGKSGYDPVYTQNAINAQYNKSIIHVIPTVSSGFNNIGWGGTRSPNMSVADFASMMLWVKNTALPRNDPNSWKSKLAIISTWNEYGEGTYVMPSGLNGFGYLDGIRAAFTTNPVHSDARPSDNQQSRLEYLIPKNRALIRSLQKESAAYPSTVLASWNFVVNNSVSTAWSYGNMAAPYVSGSAITATATNDDPLISIKNDINVDISDVTYIKVRASGISGNSIQVFFTTDTDGTIDEEKSISTSITGTGMTDYYFPISTISTWTGILKRLRIDPLSSINSFSIESVSLLYDANQTEVMINGTQAPLWCKPVYLNSHYMIPMLPETGIFYYFNSYYEWDKANKVLYMTANHHNITFTMGNANATVDGVSTPLGCTPYLLDGIPMVPIDALVNAFDYDITYGTGLVTVTTPWKPYYDILNNVNNNQWEFNLNGFTEGWTFGNATSDFTVAGAIGGTASNNSGKYDPMVYSPNVNITQGSYSKIVVGMKYTLYNATSGTARIFYQTSDSQVWNSTQSIIGTPTISTASNSNYVEYTFNLSAVTGTITSFRFDPFDASGTFYIDYIRFQ